VDANLAKDEMSRKRSRKKEGAQLPFVSFYHHTQAEHLQLHSTDALAHILSVVPHFLLLLPAPPFTQLFSSLPLLSAFLYFSALAFFITHSLTISILP
jgi:hypothetical protein